MFFLVDPHPLLRLRMKKDRRADRSGKMTSFLFLLFRVSCCRAIIYQIPVFFFFSCHTLLSLNSSLSLSFSLCVSIRVFFVLVRGVQLTDDLRHLPDMLMEVSAMTSLQNAHQENLALDLPLPALLRR